MIIRKPYAFLIKNFRLIHFFMLLVSSFIFFKTLNALDFFNEYVDTRQFLSSDTLIGDTVPIFMIILTIFLIFACTSIFILFKRKDKPTLFYISSIIYYAIFIVICIISRSIIKTIILDGLDPRIARIVRDVWFIALLLQIAVIAFSLIRTLGFDVKKFNFGEDLHELQIEAEDNEEIEISSAFDADKVKMKARMQREELKAFFFENKFMIILILFLLLVVIPTTLVARSIIQNKRYKIGEIIDLDGLNLTITNAYVSKKDYNGNSLFKGDNSYLIVLFEINNLEEEKRGINLNNLRLEVSDKIYLPKTNYYQYFTDIGTGYNAEKISKGKKNYIAIYAIKDEDLEHEMIIRYADKITVKNSQATAIYYRTIITPENIDREQTIVNRNIGEDLIIDYNQLKGTKLNISSYDIADEFTYSLNDKVRYIVNSVGSVMMLNYNFTSDNLSFSDFLEKNVTMIYKYNGNTYTQKISNITPSAYKTDSIYLAVTENLKKATAISLVVNVRNTRYIYKLV